jgi:hypothetical protein
MELTEYNEPVNNKEGDLALGFLTEGDGGESAILRCALLAAVSFRSSSPRFYFPSYEEAAAGSSTA